MRLIDLLLLASLGACDSAQTETTSDPALKPTTPATEQPSSATQAPAQPLPTEPPPPDSAEQSGVPPFSPPQPCTPAKVEGALTGKALEQALHRVRSAGTKNPNPAVLMATCDVEPIAVARALNKGGLVLHREKLFERSQRYWTAALRADPSYLPSRFNLACALALRGEPAAAVAQLQQLATAPSGDKWLKRAQKDTDLNSLRGREDYLKIFDPSRPDEPIEVIDGDGGTPGPSAPSPSTTGSAPAGPGGRTAPCAALPASCSGQQDLCEHVYGRIYQPAAFEKLVECMRSNDCRHSCAERTWPKVADADARRRCDSIGRDLSDPDTPNTRRDWRRDMKDTCPRLMSSLSEEGRDGATRCVLGQCFSEGCLITLTECVADLSEEDTAEWYDIELPE